MFDEYNELKQTIVEYYVIPKMDLLRQFSVLFSEVNKSDEIKRRIGLRPLFSIERSLVEEANIAQARVLFI